MISIKQSDDNINVKIHGEDYQLRLKQLLNFHNYWENGIWYPWNPFYMGNSGFPRTNIQTSVFFFFYNDFYFFHCSCFIVNFLLYSRMTQSHIHVYILSSHLIMLHNKLLDIVPSAIQQDLIAYPFQMQ